MNKTLKVMTSAALLAGVVAPVAVTTVDAASGKIEALQVPTVVADTGAGTADLGVLKITIPAGSKTATQDVTLKLSTGSFASFTTAANIELGGDNSNSVTVAVDDSKKAKGIITLTLDKDVSLKEDLILYVSLDNVTLTGKTGEITTEVIASGTSGIPSGKVVVANAATSGSVAVTAAGTQSSNDTFNFKLRLKENIADSIENGEYVELKLPAGFEWKDLAVSDNQYYGDTISLDGTKTYGVNDDKARLTFNRSGSGDDAYVEFELQFHVVDATVAKEGDVVVSLSSKGFDIDSKDLTVGTYGDYGTSVTSAADEAVYSGKNEQEIADVVVKEKLADTLIKKRTVTLTLPEGVKWHSDSASIDSTENEGVELLNSGSILSSGRVLKFEVSRTDVDDPAELKIKDLKINVAADFTGDIVAEIDGSAGVTGKVTLAKATPAVSATVVGETPELIIGDVAQSIADFEITEAVKEAFERNTSGSTVSLELPAGVYWDGTPNVEVTEGDLRIENVKANDDSTALTFNVKSSSFKPSKIKVSGAKVKVYRTVPEGNVTLKVKGLGIVDEPIIGNADTAATVVVAKVVTPAAGKVTTTTSVFSIGSTTYTVDGVEKTMTVAPFVEAATGRTYMPVRYVAESVGVVTENILWDQATQTATIIKGDRIAQLTVGSNVLKVNGANISMDSKVQNKDGRVVLPVRAVSQALGANVTYDAATSTVTVK